MVFSKIINNMKNILDDSEKGKNNKKIIDNLINQGKLHKRNKQIKIKNFNEKKHIIENNSNIFSKGDKKINNMHENTSQVLQSLQQEYNTDLAAWGTGHKSFMDNYTRFMGLIDDCHVYCHAMHFSEISSYYQCCFVSCGYVLLHNLKCVENVNFNFEFYS